MKEDWIVILESTKHSDVLSLKDTLTLRKIESYVRFNSRKKNTYRLYIPMDKLAVAKCVKAN